MNGDDVLMDKNDPRIKERLDKYIKTPSHEKTSFFLLKRPKYMQRFYNSLCPSCSIRTRQEVIKGTLKIDNDLSFFCDDCKVALLPLLEKIQYKCERLYSK